MAVDWWLVAAGWWLEAGDWWLGTDGWKLVAAWGLAPGLGLGWLVTSIGWLGLAVAGPDWLGTGWEVFRPSPAVSGRLQPSPAFSSCKAATGFPLLLVNRPLDNGELDSSQGQL